MNKHPFLPAPTAVALCFGLLCLSALSSVTILFSALTRMFPKPTFAP